MEEHVVPDLNEPIPIYGTPNQDDLDVNANESGAGRTRNFLCDDTRRAIYSMILERTAPGVMKRGVMKSVAEDMGVPLRVVQRIWTTGKHGGGVHAVCNKRAKNCGRKRIHIDPQDIRDVPLRDRTTLRDLAHALHVTPSTLFLRLKKGELTRQTNDIKFSLTEENKKSRLRFCISMLDIHSIPHDPIFKGMYNMVYIDEKWFYMTKKCQNYYLAPGEDKPLRTVKNKNFIGKVMFLAAIARPRFDDQGNEMFSGKIGIFPFTYTEPAQRSSVNRPAGTMVTKPMPSVNKQTIRSYLIDKVMPTIKQKWPIEDSTHPIFIQQDNARTHIDPNDEEFCRVAKEDGFDIRLMCQPPNSPDLNVLDLGFFAAIQSIQMKNSSKTVEELVSAVVKAYEEYPTDRSNHIFLTQQSCMREIIREKGSQHYVIPHMQKKMLERNDELPRSLKCDTQIVEEARVYLN
ncbi:uncharacterized protein LOC133907240 [Phragmites australis]|uniref:uncharacterized protein LOC133907240 n=1 Tax=Phragmites australis TaxID=29695 RepID=UPI002D76AAFA|nr:uncharacterized protein LOC133907240 [Phragmites australis]